MRVPRKRWLALLINFVFWPLGFYYLRNHRRFLTYTFLSFLVAPVVSLFAWLLPVSSWGGSHLTLVILLWLAIFVAIMYDTIPAHARAPQSELGFYRKPLAYAFVPAYLVVTITLMVMLEPIHYPFARTYNIPSGSMEPTLRTGDFVMVNDAASISKLKRGDVITFQGAEDLADKVLIKRLIGLPGDTIRIFQQKMKAGEHTFAATRVEINGKLVPLTFKSLEEGKGRVLLIERLGEIEHEVYEDANEISYPSLNRGEITLNKGEYFVMGDNRDNSRDSRFQGAVPKSRLGGRYMYSYMSLEWSEGCGDESLGSPLSRLVFRLQNDCPFPSFRLSTRETR